MYRYGYAYLQLFTCTHRSPNKPNPTLKQPQTNFKQTLYRPPQKKILNQPQIDPKTTINES